ncbi:MAG: hypothetical protein DRJ07_03110 [Bacteroidetes bacterium]|nr:MAG: hypothetical protein DRJ07_03110 [Bacteroidota bacterium]
MIDKLEYFEETEFTKLGVKINHSKLNHLKNVFKIQIGMFIIELHPDHIKIEDDMNKGSNGECATENFLYGYMYDEELTLDNVAFMEYAEKTAIYSLIIGYLENQR